MSLPRAAAKAYCTAGEAKGFEFALCGWALSLRRERFYEPDDLGGGLGAMGSGRCNGLRI